MVTMHVKLPDDMRVRVDALVESGEFESSTAYIRDLVRADLSRRATTAQLAEKLQAGFEGEGEAFNPEMWRRFSDRVLADTENTRR